MRGRGKGDFGARVRAGCGKRERCVQPAPTTDRVAMVRPCGAPERGRKAHTNRDEGGGEEGEREEGRERGKESGERGKEGREREKEGRGG